jgi:hypothetical protein
MNDSEIHRQALEPSIDIQEPKKKVFKPGLQFEATVSKLAAKYKDLETIFRHMSLGQISKHTEKDGCIYHIDKGLIYDSNTGEINEQQRI